MPVVPHFQTRSVTRWVTTASTGWWLVTLSLWLFAWATVHEAIAATAPPQPVRLDGTVQVLPLAQRSVAWVDATGQLTVDQVEQQAVDLPFERRGRDHRVTLGAQGALFHDGVRTVHVPAFSAGPVVETTGAGDAFNGGFAVALSEGRNVIDAVRFGCATAGISVTRPGTAPAMPSRNEIDALLAR
jgi:hypothetical protein